MMKNVLAMGATLNFIEWNGETLEGFVVICLFNVVILQMFSLVSYSIVFRSKSKARRLSH